MISAVSELILLVIPIGEPIRKGLVTCFARTAHDNGTILIENTTRIQELPDTWQDCKPGAIFKTA